MAWGGAETTSEPHSSPPVCTGMERTPARIDHDGHMGLGGTQRGAWLSLLFQTQALLKTTCSS